MKCAAESLRGQVDWLGCEELLAGGYGDSDAIGVEVEINSIADPDVSRAPHRENEKTVSNGNLEIAATERDCLGNHRQKRLAGQRSPSAVLYPAKVS